MTIRNRIKSWHKRFHRGPKISVKQFRNKVLNLNLSFSQNSMSMSRMIICREPLLFGDLCHLMPSYAHIVRRCQKSCRFQVPSLPGTSEDDRGATRSIPCSWRWWEHENGGNQGPQGGRSYPYTILLTIMLTMLYKIHRVGTRSIKKGRVTQWLLTSLSIS